ncbi:MAG: M28 family peptidase [Firmicutes bacterium]|nr:M28 family peptidase [Bacillota bacterium]
MKTIKTAALVLITLAIGIVLGLWQITPPPVDEASPAYPAYRRMMENIQRLAREPHPAGSEAIARVRAEIIAEIEGMGLTPILEDAVYTPSQIADARVRRYNMTKDEWWAQNHDWVEEYNGIHSVDDWFAMISGADSDGVLRLQNILVKLEARETPSRAEPGPAVLFVSHYDSVSAGPGAGDNMLSVCAMLETIRAQAQNNALRGDLYFLFADGEEDFMLGSLAFVRAHPEFKEKMDVVINLDTRGSRGALLLYETSPKAYALVKAVRSAGARPAGFSLAAAVYARMNNYTDLSMFLNRGYRGLNLAAMEGVENYHRATDTYANLHPATAWHYLQTSLALAEYAANHYSPASLREPSSGAVYFPFLPGRTVLMSDRAAYALCALACVLALAYAGPRIKRGGLRPFFSGVLMGLPALLCAGCAIFFVEASYLFSIPLLLMAVTAFLKKGTIARITARMASGVVTLMLWVPVLYLLWVAMVQPMLISA